MVLNKAQSLSIGHCLGPTTEWNRSSRVPSRHWTYNVRTLYVQFRFALMDVQCTYIVCLGSHPVPKRNIRITYGLGSDRFSPNYQKSMCVWFWFTLRCKTGLYVQCTYGSVRTMYVHVRTYIVRKRTKYG